MRKCWQWRYRQLYTVEEVRSMYDAFYDADYESSDESDTDTNEDRVWAVRRIQRNWRRVRAKMLRCEET